MGLVAAVLVDVVVVVVVVAAAAATDFDLITASAFAVFKID